MARGKAISVKIQTAKVIKALEGALAKLNKDYVQMNDWTYREQKEEIENAIRILKMTDEEVVSTSTYNAIARYL